MIRWLKKHNKISWTITLILFIIIFVQSSIPSQEIQKVVFFNWQSYIYHFAVFFLLAFFLSLSLINKKRKNIPLLLFAIIISIVYAILDEFHQYFVLGRSTGIIDIFTDTLGILSASIVFYLLNKEESSTFK